MADENKVEKFLKDYAVIIISTLVIILIFVIVFFLMRGNKCKESLMQSRYY